MLLRLLFLVLGLAGTVPLLYVIKKGGMLESSLYQYAAVGLCAGLGGLLFSVAGFLSGAVLGLVAFKMKEDLVCNCIEGLVRKVKPMLRS